MANQINKLNLKELDKLEEYLKSKGVNYERKKRGSEYIDTQFVKAYRYGVGEQIVVFDDSGHREWDAILGYGSYGCEQGLLEVMGSKVVRPDDGDSVCGFLTAEDVIKRLEVQE